MRVVTTEQFQEDYISNHPSFTGILIDYRKRKLWYRNGNIHREGGPAVIYLNGTKEWYQNGLRHREGGPAIERADGVKAWYQNGLRHREDGPARELPDGRKRWWINGEPITEEEHGNWVRKKKLEAFLDGDN